MQVRPGSDDQHRATVREENKRRCDLPDLDAESVSCFCCGASRFIQMTYLASCTEPGQGLAHSNNRLLIQGTGHGVRLVRVRFFITDVSGFDVFHLYRPTAKAGTANPRVARTAKHLATSHVTTNFIREVVEGKEMPA